jgi:hypothetical protein
MDPMHHEVLTSASRNRQLSGTAQVLKQTRWCLLKQPENLTESQSVRRRVPNLLIL